MKRRQFIAAAPALAISTIPFRAQSATRRIGYLGTPFTDERIRDAWRSGLRERGWIEGNNLLVEYRHGTDRWSELAAELIALSPELIVSRGPQAARALKAATATIPIVFLAVYDPVAVGLVETLSHPGGNVTGVTSYTPADFLAKRLEILKELLPSLSKIAILTNPNNPVHRLAYADFPPNSRNFGVSLFAVEVTTGEEINNAFALAAAQHADAIIVLGDPLINVEGPRIVTLAKEYGLPDIYQFREGTSGGLIVYGSDLTDLFRHAGRYVDAVLKGIKPAELPVEQPTKYELIINLKTAKALGLAVPASLLVRADEVIE